MTEAMRPDHVEALRQKYSKRGLFPNWEAYAPGDVVALCDEVKRLQEVADARGMLLEQHGVVMTAEELAAMELLGNAAGAIRRLIGDGPCARSDWAEAADKIHQLQAMVMAQLASRAHPDRFRPLGGRPEAEQ